MFRRSSRNDQAAIRDALAIQQTLDKVQAVIWFDLDGTILDANENFLAALGYELDEIQGNHHRMFVEPGVADSAEYREFWDHLASGAFHRGEFERVRKDGGRIWIEASYNPVLDEAGKPVKVVKFAIDITEAKARSSEATSKLNALSKSQAVIEFDLDGTILTANDNFLNAMGYRLDEVQGKHHRIFVAPDYAGSPEYKTFWDELATGRYHSGEFRRLTKKGHEVWIQASYNPILGASGQPVKVVKFASDVTAAKLAASDSAGQLEAISKSQAVIAFEPDGTILSANDNFLATMGYSEDEIVGRHHRMFVDPETAKSEEYGAFWDDLKAGNFRSGEYKRFGKGGKEVTIQASYNPIFNPGGKVYKVVKYASVVSDKEKVLDALVERMKALSKGDLTVRMPDAMAEEFAEIRDAFNDTVIRLDELVGGILDTSILIADETSAISDNANNLSGRGERQAATVEETSAAMEEILQTVTTTSANAEKATSMATTASENAQSGGAIVESAVEAMTRIQASTKEIEKILEVIDGIAFQTNLLALNAGVEAARAGDAGRGFAVVASEVRALAQRASESAGEINELITRSNKEVAEGAQLVNQSGEALSEIVNDVAAVVDGIEGILTATSEQTSAIKEVNEAISDIDSTTQQTAALAEESAAASKQLADRAKQLRELVRFFSGDIEAPAAQPRNSQNTKPATKASDRTAPARLECRVPGATGC